MDWLDRNLKLKSRIDQLKDSNVFTRNTFKCKLKQPINPNSRLKLFKIRVRPTLDFSKKYGTTATNHFYWSVLDCEHNHYIFEKQQILKRFCIYNTRISMTTESIFHEKLSMYLTSVDCARSLNLVIVDRLISVSRNCLRISYVSNEQERMDCMKDFINFVQARKEATSKLSTKTALTTHGNVRQTKNKRYQITVEWKMAKKLRNYWTKQNPTKNNLNFSDFC